MRKHCIKSQIEETVMYDQCIYKPCSVCIRFLVRIY